MAIVSSTRLSVRIAALVVFASQARAHPGPHAGLDLGAIAEHFATPFHILPAAAIVFSGAGLLLWRRKSSGRHGLSRNRKDHRT